MKKDAEYPILTFESQAAWERWLEQNHAAAAGVWLKFAKKDSGIASVDYTEALEGALCYGWIDGQRTALDEQYFLQKFTPRRAKSNWSLVNRNKVLALIAAGRMQPAGLREIEKAQADGRWAAAERDALEPEMPGDFQQALDANPAAKEFFAGVNQRNRRTFLQEIAKAKRPETRAARIEKFTAMLSRGEKLVP
jgi:uncharacterized protein YdeI (YjbR/CyaY-like superfamily)